VNFEGNANAIRVLTHQQNGKDEGGTQLTYTTLRALQNILAKPLPRKKDLLIVRNLVFFKVKKKRF
jgi:dGTPase